MSEHNTEMIMVRLKPAVVTHLDKMKDEGGYKSRAELIRLLIEAIVKDDIAARGGGMSKVERRYPAP